MAKRFSVEQIVVVLRKIAIGTPEADLISETGISRRTLYRWKTKYGGMAIDHRQLTRLRKENLKLQQEIAELTLIKSMLEDVLKERP